MPFRITALDPAPFAPLFDLDDATLAARGIVRQTVDASPGSPCRVSLEDAAVGDTVLLLGHEHLSGTTPYRATHAIFVRQGAARAHPAPGEIPEVIARRLISARAIDADGMMLAAEVVDGRALGPVLDRMLAEARVDTVHLHNAAPGCFAARVERA